ncbi:MAG: phosphotransferase [Gemmatimonadetes bacterium]|nr:phosphotransferase [Gemmatimonadota bacterium]
MYRPMYRLMMTESRNDRGTPPLREGESADMAAVTHYLRRLAEDGHGFAMDPRRVRSLAGGFNNRIYEVDTSAGIYLLKVYPGDRARRLEREFAALTRLSSLEEVPNAVFADPMAAGLNAPVLIYDKLPGSAVEPASMNREDLALLIGIAVAVHAVRDPGDLLLATPAGPSRPGDCLAYMDGTMRAMSASPAMNDPPFHLAVERLLDLRRCLAMADLRPALWADAPPRLCHGDLRPANVIKAERDGVGLVDWEHAGIMDPFYEIAGFFCHPESAALASGLREESIAVYCEKSADPHAFEKMAVYQIVLPVQWCVRILSLIEGYDRQAVQSWNELRPLEALWEDLGRYAGLAGKRLGTGMRGSV